MPTMTSAISALATFGGTVSGIANSYDLSAIPEKISRSLLPCLIPIPEVGPNQGLRSLAMGGAQMQFNFDVKHLLLYASSDSVPVHLALSGLIPLLDAYNAAFKGNPFLSGLTAPAQHGQPAYGIDIGITNFAGINYHSIVFNYHMLINL